jgi:hypothetical protein
MHPEAKVCSIFQDADVLVTCAENSMARATYKAIGDNVEQHVKSKGFTRSIIGALIVALIALATAAWIAWQQRTNAVSRTLAASALVQVTQNPELGQLLAVEAINTAATAEAEQALRETLIKAAVITDNRMRLDAEQPGTAGLDGPVLTITAGAPNITGQGLYGIRNVLFSADGRLLTAVDENGGASVWQIPTLALQERLTTFAAIPKDEPEVRSPDKHLVIQLGSPATIVDRVHGSSRGELALPQPVVAAAFSPDGLRIAVADGSPDVRIYRWESFAPVEELIAMVRKRVARDLSPKERSEFVP